MSQKNIISIGCKLGYLKYDALDGACQGITMAWLLACLASNEERYSTLIKEIQEDKNNKDYAEDNEIVMRVRAVDEKIKSGTKLTNDDEQIFQILSFYSQVALYQNPRLYSQLFNTYYTQSNLDDITQLAASEKIDQLGGLSLLGVDTRIFTQERELQNFLYKTQQTIDSAVSMSAIDTPIAFDLCNHNHAIGLIYLPKTQTWKVLDVNRNGGLAKESQSIEIVAAFIHDLANIHEHSSLSIKMFTTGNHPDSAKLKEHFASKKTAYLNSLTEDIISFDLAPMRLEAIAVRGGDMATLQKVLALTPIQQMNLQKKLDIFMPAITWGQLPIARELLKDNSFKDELLRNYSKMIIESALKVGDAEVLQLLAEHGFNLNSPDLKTRKKNSPIVRAVQSQQIEIVKVLLEHGASCNDMNCSGYTKPLVFIALENNDSAMISLLLKQPNLDLYATIDNGENLLHYAITRRNLPFLKLLLESPDVPDDLKQAWLNQRETFHQRTPQEYYFNFINPEQQNESINAIFKSRSEHREQPKSSGLTFFPISSPPPPNPAPSNSHDFDFSAEKKQIIKLLEKLQNRYGAKNDKGEVYRPDKLQSLTETIALLNNKSEPDEELTKKWREMHKIVNHRVWDFKKIDDFPNRDDNSPVSLDVGFANLEPDEQSTLKRFIDKIIEYIKDMISTKPGPGSC